LKFFFVGGEMSEPRVSTSDVLPYASRKARRLGRWGFVALVICWVYPWLPLAAFYATWVAAWIALGHRPHPSLDDPKGISSIVYVFYVIAGSSLMSMPMGMLVGVSVGIVLTVRLEFMHAREHARTALAIFMLVASYVVAFALFVWDPLRVVYWFMD
jgi:hypothetical protein